MTDVSASRKLAMWKLVCIASGLIVVALVLLELAARITVNLARYPRYGLPEMDLKYNLARGPHSGDATIFFMGASYSARGVFADLIERRLRDNKHAISVYNLASPDSFSGEQLFLLKTAIDHGATPGAVVYELIPNVLNTTAQNYSALFSKSPEGQLIAPSSSTSPFDAFLQRHFYFAKYATPLRWQVLQTLNMLQEPQKDFQFRFNFGNHWECSRGGWLTVMKEAGLMPSAAPTTRERFIQLQRVFPKKEGTFAKPTYDPILPIRDFCALHHIPLVLLRLPVSPHFQSYNELALKQTDKEWSEEFAAIAREWNTPLIDLHTGENPSYFSDVDHLNIFGAIDVSERIAEQILANEELLKKIESSPVH